MHLEEAIFQKLSTNLNISNIVGSKIYHIRLPDNPVFPCISYNRISTTRELTLTDTVSMANALVDVHAWSESDLECRNLSLQIVSALNGFRGAVTSLYIERIIQLNEIDMYEDDTEIFHTVNTFRILYQE